LEFRANRIYHCQAAVGLKHHERAFDVDFIKKSSGSMKLRALS
jgi:hypothetical protein